MDGKMCHEGKYVAESRIHRCPVIMANHGSNSKNNSAVRMTPLCLDVRACSEGDNGSPGFGSGQLRDRGQLQVPPSECWMDRSMMEAKKNGFLGMH